MVCRAWLLLMAAGCKATDLGIVVPPKGIDALSEEDLARDAYALSQAGSFPNQLNYLEKRLHKMNLSTQTSDTQVCGYRGHYKQHDFVIVVENLDTVEDAGAWLVSLAKTRAHLTRDTISICLSTTMKLSQYIWLIRPTEKQFQLDIDSKTIEMPLRDAPYFGESHLANLKRIGQLIFK